MVKSNGILWPALSFLSGPAFLMVNLAFHRIVSKLYWTSK